MSCGVSTGCSHWKGEIVKELIFPSMNQKNSDFLSSSITREICPLPLIPRPHCCSCVPQTASYTDPKFNIYTRGAELSCAKHYSQYIKRGFLIPDPILLQTK